MFFYGELKNTKISLHLFFKYFFLIKLVSNKLVTQNLFPLN